MKNYPSPPTAPPLTRPAASLICPNGENYSSRTAVLNFHYKQEQCVSLFPRPGNHISAMFFCLLLSTCKAKFCRETLHLGIFVILMLCSVYSARFTIVLRCAQCPVGQGAHLPAKKNQPFLWWIFAYVVQLKILKFPEHVCLTACVGLPGLPPSGPTVRSLIT